MVPVLINFLQPYCFKLVRFYLTVTSRLDKLKLRARLGANPYGGYKIWYKMVQIEYIILGGIGATIFIIMTLCITTFIITTLSLKGLFVTLSIRNT